MASEAHRVLTGMTVKELKGLAKDHGIDLGKARRKADIVDVLAATTAIEALLGLPERLDEPPPPPPPPGWEPPPPPEDIAPYEEVTIEQAPSIDVGRLDYATKAELMELAEASGLDTSGSWQDLHDRLASLAGGAEPPPEEAVAAPPEVLAPEEDVREALSAMTVKELKTLAKGQGIGLGKARRKADIVDVIASSPNVMDVVREELRREEATIEAMEAAMDEVGAEAEEIIEEVVDIPPMDVPGADDEIAQGLNIDVDFGNVEDLLDQARMRFEEANFDRASGLASEALTMADISVAKFQRSALAYALVSAQQLIEDAARAGHDVEDAVERLVEAKKRYSDGTLMQDPLVIRSLQGATRELYSKDIQRGREALYEAGDLVADAEGLGADVSAAREYLRQARVALDRADHGEAVQMSALAMEAAEESRLRRIEAIQQAIPITYGVIQEARNVGSDVTEADRLIKQAEIALEARDFVLVSELVRRAERSAMESQHYQIEKAMELRRRQVENAQALIAELEPSLVKARRLKIDVSEAEALLAKAREVLADGDYVNGTMYAKEAQELVRRIAPQLEERELSAGIAKPSGGVCRECRSRNLVFYDNGWGKCMDCGRTFQWRKDEDVTLWGKLRDFLTD